MMADRIINGVLMACGALIFYELVHHGVLSADLAIKIITGDVP